MNSYANFGGAARRHVSAISEKPMGGTYVPPPPAVRGLNHRRTRSALRAPLVIKTYLWESASCQISSFLKLVLKYAAAHS